MSPFSANGAFVLALESSKIKFVSASASGTLTLGGSGSEYELFLVDGTTYAPLCEAWHSNSTWQ